MTLSLTNTLTQSKEIVSPAHPDRVTLYVCGPTVYNFAHIGNARPAVVFDVLYRLLKRRFSRVLYARNFTDVDDKINAAAQETGSPITAITDRFIAAYRADMTALGVLTPDFEPRVTEHIPEIIAMVRRLIDLGHAYEAEDHVLFHVPSFPEYGALSRRDTDEMIAGARVEVAPFKRHPADFVLWKPSSDDLPGWASPWGRGRPGWHIECSAMIENLLGDSIDIHGGGQDLIFPHHENEIAQGTCAHDGELYCRHWVHNGFVTVDGRKMSKSLGNVLLVRDLLDQAPGEAIRFALMGAHYRQPLDWSASGLAQAKRSLDRLYAVLEAIDGQAAEAPAILLQPFYSALEDDLNFPKATAELFAMAKAARLAQTPLERAEYRAALLEAGDALGILQQDPASWLAHTTDGVDEARIETLIAARQSARVKKDYAEADRIRNELAEMGIEVKDRADGASWQKIG
ncbi:MAG: cysteine--tRNA ligase [Halieaceae bacterium]|nr:cysteine--tRNA ligase [Halieaceae bacterium]